MPFTEETRAVTYTFIGIRESIGCVCCVCACVLRPLPASIVVLFGRWVVLCVCA